MRLLIVLILHCTFNITIGFTMFVVLNTGYKWVGLALSCMSLVVFF